MVSMGDKIDFQNSAFTGVHATFGRHVISDPYALPPIHDLDNAVHTGTAQKINSRHRPYQINIRCDYVQFCNDDKSGRFSAKHADAITAQLHKALHEEFKGEIQFYKKSANLMLKIYAGGDGTSIKAINERVSEVFAQVMGAHKAIFEGHSSLLSATSFKNPGLIHELALFEMAYKSSPTAGTCTTITKIPKDLAATDRRPSTTTIKIPARLQAAELFELVRSAQQQRPDIFQSVLMTGSNKKLPAAFKEYLIQVNRMNWLKQKFTTDDVHIYFRQAGERIYDQLRNKGALERICTVQMDKMNLGAETSAKGWKVADAISFVDYTTMIKKALQQRLASYGFRDLHVVVGGDEKQLILEFKEPLARQRPAVEALIQEAQNEVFQQINQREYRVTRDEVMKANSNKYTAEHIWEEHLERARHDKAAHIEYDRNKKPIAIRAPNSFFRYHQHKVLLDCTSIRKTASGHRFINTLRLLGIITDKQMVSRKPVALKLVLGSFEPDIRRFLIESGLVRELSGSFWRGAVVPQTKSSISGNEFFSHCDALVQTTKPDDTKGSHFHTSHELMLMQKSGKKSPVVDNSSPLTLTEDVFKRVLRTDEQGRIVDELINERIKARSEDAARIRPERRTRPILIHALKDLDTVPVGSKVLYKKSGISVVIDVVAGDKSGRVCSIVHGHIQYNGATVMVIRDNTMTITGAGENICKIMDPAVRDLLVSRKALAGKTLVIDARQHPVEFLNFSIFQMGTQLKLQGTRADIVGHLAYLATQYLGITRTYPNMENVSSLHHLYKDIVFTDGTEIDLKKLSAEVAERAAKDIHDVVKLSEAERIRIHSKIRTWISNATKNQPPSEFSPGGLLLTSISTPERTPAAPPKQRALPSHQQVLDLYRQATIESPQQKAEFLKKNITSLGMIGTYEAYTLKGSGMSEHATSSGTILYDRQAKKLTLIDVPIASSLDLCRVFTALRIPLHMVTAGDIHVTHGHADHFNPENIRALMMLNKELTLHLSRNTPRGLIDLAPTGIRHQLQSERSGILTAEGGRAVGKYVIEGPGHGYTGRLPLYSIPLSPGITLSYFEHTPGAHTVPGGFFELNSGKEISIITGDARPDPKGFLAERIREHIKNRTAFRVVADCGTPPLHASFEQWRAFIAVEYLEHAKDPSLAVQLKAARSLASTILSLQERLTRLERSAVRLMNMALNTSRPDISLKHTTGIRTEADSARMDDLRKKAVSVIDTYSEAVVGTQREIDAARSELKKAQANLDQLCASTIVNGKNTQQTLSAIAEGMIVPTHGGKAAIPPELLLDPAHGAQKIAAQVRLLLRNSKGALRIRKKEIIEQQLSELSPGFVKAIERYAQTPDDLIIEARRLMHTDKPGFIDHMKEHHRAILKHFAKTGYADTAAADVINAYAARISHHPRNKAQYGMGSVGRSSVIEVWKRSMDLTTGGGDIVLHYTDKKGSTYVLTFDASGHGAQGSEIATKFAMISDLIMSRKDLHTLSVKDIIHEFVKFAGYQPLKGGEWLQGLFGFKKISQGPQGSMVEVAGNCQLMYTYTLERDPRSGKHHARVEPLETGIKRFDAMAALYQTAKDIPVKRVHIGSRKGVQGIIELSDGLYEFNQGKRNASDRLNLPEGTIRSLLETTLSDRADNGKTISVQDIRRAIYHELNQRIGEQTEVSLTHGNREYRIQRSKTRQATLEIREQGTLIYERTITEQEWNRRPEALLEKLLGEEKNATVIDKHPIAELLHKYKRSLAGIEYERHIAATGDRPAMKYTIRKEAPGQYHTVIEQGGAVIKDIRITVDDITGRIKQPHALDRALQNSVPDKAQRDVVCSLFERFIPKEITTASDDQTVLVLHERKGPRTHKPFTLSDRNVDTPARIMIDLPVKDLRSFIGSPDEIQLLRENTGRPLVIRGGERITLKLRPELIMHYDQALHDLKNSAVVLDNNILRELHFLSAGKEKMPTAVTTRDILLWLHSQDPHGKINGYTLMELAAHFQLVERFEHIRSTIASELQKNSGARNAPGLASKLFMRFAQEHNLNRAVLVADAERGKGLSLKKVALEQYIVNDPEARLLKVQGIQRASGITVEDTTVPSLHDQRASLLDFIKHTPIKTQAYFQLLEHYLKTTEKNAARYEDAVKIFNEELVHANKGQKVDISRLETLIKEHVNEALIVDYIQRNLPKYLAHIDMPSMIDAYLKLPPTQQAEVYKNIHKTMNARIGIEGASSLFGLLVMVGIGEIFTKTGVTNPALHMFLTMYSGHAASTVISTPIMAIINKSGPVRAALLGVLKDVTLKNVAGFLPRSLFSMGSMLIFQKIATNALKEQGFSDEAAAYAGMAAGLLPQVSIPVIRKLALTLSHNATRASMISSGSKFLSRFAGPVGIVLSGIEVANIVAASLDGRTDYKQFLEQRCLEASSSDIEKFFKEEPSTLKTLASIGYAPIHFLSTSFMNKLHSLFISNFLESGKAIANGIMLGDAYSIREMTRKFEHTLASEFLQDIQADPRKLPTIHNPVPDLDVQKYSDRINTDEKLRDELINSIHFMRLVCQEKDLFHAASFTGRVVISTKPLVFKSVTHLNPKEIIVRANQLLSAIDIKNVNGKQIITVKDRSKFLRYIVYSNLSIDKSGTQMLASSYYRNALDQQRMTQASLISDSDPFRTVDVKYHAYLDTEGLPARYKEPLFRSVIAQRTARINTLKKNVDAITKKLHARQEALIHMLPSNISKQERDELMVKDSVLSTLVGTLLEGQQLLTAHQNGVLRYRLLWFKHRNDPAKQRQIGSILKAYGDIATDWQQQGPYYAKLQDSADKLIASSVDQEIKIALLRELISQAVPM